MMDLQKEFSKTLDKFGGRYDLTGVFNDLLTVSICSFHQTNIQSRCLEKDEDNEALYMETIKRYDPEELDILAEALGVLQLNVLNNPYSDILGEYFMLNITKGQNGQYFTPEPVCDMMAMITGAETSGTGNRVLDPACGSARMQLSYAKLNPDNYFFGADNSLTCAKMSVLNFFFNGLRGEVACMNSLSMEFYQGWHINTNGLGIIPIEKEQSTIWSKPPERKLEPPKKRGKSPPHNASQLELF